jgi:hypothetical protein
MGRFLFDAKSIFFCLNHSGSRKTAQSRRAARRAQSLTPSDLDRRPQRMCSIPDLISSGSNEGALVQCAGILDRHARHPSLLWLAREGGG